MLGHFKQVQPFYEASDIFICPSVTEGLSNSILEAMSFSIPVIATKVGGNPEIIEHGVNGLLVPAKNSNELANAIQILVENSKKCSELAENGLNTIKNNFSFKERTKRLQKIYIESLSKVGKNYCESLENFFE